MTETNQCPGCGAALDGAAPGRCPGCHIRLGLDGTDLILSGQGPGVTASSPTGVLETIARTVGTVPRVLLRDTAPGEMPGPVVRTQGALRDASIRYRIDGEIARGGMGAVLKGRDPDLGRDVALKVLRDDYRGDPTMVRRFVEEAQIGGQLQHPGIVPIYEMGTLADQRPFFAMKLVKGHTLAELLNARKSPLDEIARSLSIFEAICQTMAYAHARGVIHRDLKPSNVMVGSCGEVQVMDWGLAKVLRRGGIVDDAGAGLTHGETVIATARSDSDADLSQAGSILGTLAYMAPEQARGEVEDLDQRADVFALGSILCEILTGAPAFTGRTVGEVHRKAARGDLADAVARLGTGDGGLAPLCRDCLAPEREDRPADASAVAARITAHLAGVQERLRSAERDRAVAEARAVEERRRRRLQAGLAAASLVIAGLGCAGGLYVQQQRSERSAALDRQLGEAQTLLAQARQTPEATAPWQKAVDAVARVQEQAGKDPASRQRLAAIRSDAEAGSDFARRITRLREALVDARSSQSDMSDDEVDDIYSAAFRDAGLNPDELKPAGLAGRLKPLPAPVLAEIAAFLDDWSSYRQLRVPPADWRTPIEAARAIDPDPFRERLREALLIGDAAERAKALRVLSVAPEVGNLPAPTAVLLGWSLEGEDGIAVLRNAARRHPGDVWANYYLAEALKAKGRAYRAEALRFYTAARAIRPDTGHQLAHLPWDSGQLEEAEVVFRDLVKHRPQDHRSAGCFGLFLAGTGRYDEAAALLDRAIAGLQAQCRKRPNSEAPYSSLALYLTKRVRLDEALALSRGHPHRPQPRRVVRRAGPDPELPGQAGGGGGDLSGVAPTPPRRQQRPG